LTVKVEGFIEAIPDYKRDEYMYSAEQGWLTYIPKPESIDFQATKST
jgi:hypothetical protein